MKRILLLLTLALTLGTSSAQAQDIFKNLLSGAKAIANNESKTMIERRIAAFKVDAMEYTYNTAFSSLQRVTPKFLDDQAYYLNQFITLYLTNVLLNSSLSKAVKKQRYLMFIDASVSNPLYKDPNKENVNCYINESQNQLTPFCLDTDWVKAFAAAQAQLK